MEPKQHYISKFLTSSWEHRKGTLRVFNCETGRIAECAANSLFARERLWPERYESIFNSLFETRIANERNRLLQAEPGDVVLPWREFRAYALLLIFHAFRLKRLRMQDPFIEKLGDLNDAQLDTIIKNHLEDFSIVKLTSLQNLFFPDTAFFGIPILLENGEWSFGSTLPLSPSCALAVLPRGFDKKWLTDLLQNDGLLRMYSTGLPGTTRCIVPPRDVLEKGTVALAREVLSLRDENLKSGWTVRHNGAVVSLIDIIKRKISDNN